GLAVGRALRTALAACARLAGWETMRPGAEVTEPQGVKVPATVLEPQQRQASEAESLISYYTQLRKLSVPDLGRELDAARQAYGRARTDYNAVPLALVASLPNPP